MSISVSYVLFLFLVSIRCILGGERPLPKICIVGGGMSGSSAGHYLRKHFGKKLNVDLYESDTVGGRLATVNIAGREYESGGSIIHERSPYMTGFTKLLGLKARDRSASGLVGLFDGKDIVFITSHYAYVTIAKLFWQYGLSIVYLEDLIEHSLNNFNRIYSLQAEGNAYTTPENLLGSLSAEFLQQLKSRLDTYLVRREFDQAFVDQFVMSAMLANYGQTTTMQAFAGSVAMAGIQPGLWSIHGGNKMVPINLIEASDVNLIKAKVTQVTLLPTRKYNVSYTQQGSEHITDYDIVILAAPFESSSIRIENLPELTLPVTRKFHRTVATFVHGVVNATYFRLSAQGDLAKGVLSTDPSLFFNSIGYQDAVDFGDRKEAPVDFSQEAVWKVFSKKPLAIKELDWLFLRHSEVKTVDWVAAYPAFNSQPYDDELPKFELHENLYYANAIEWTASAMEMVAIAGRNAALLAINRWEGNLNKIDNSETRAPTSQRVDL